MERTMTNEGVVEGLRELVDEAEALLVPESRSLPRRMRAMRARVEEARDVAAERARTAARNADGWVRENPWRTVGIAAAVGSLLGWAMGRRAYTESCTRD
jgi:ElaB/YqjD/DUF883 family membrane-anchored ribosome-binding protein